MTKEFRKQNKYVLSCCRRKAVSSAWWCVSVNLFQRVGAAALQNKPAPECFLLVFSPSSEMLSPHWEEWRTERDRLHGETSSCRYCCTVSCTQWCVKETILYSIRLEMGNQCSDHRLWGYQALENSLWSQYVRRYLLLAVDLAH